MNVSAKILQWHSGYLSSTFPTTTQGYLLIARDRRKNSRDAPKAHLGVTQNLPCTVSNTVDKKDTSPVTTRSSQPSNRCKLEKLYRCKMTPRRRRESLRIAMGWGKLADEFDTLVSSAIFQNSLILSNPPSPRKIISQSRCNQLGL